MIEKIKENKWSILFLSLLFGVLVYCSFQTFVMNDDLPYSMYYRGIERITTLKQVILNQMVDYMNINGRIFIHTIVQGLLIYGKNLWSVLNPAIIILTICLMTFFVTNVTKNNKINKLFIIMAFATCFLILYNYKYLIYWVAGSVNYVWVFAIMMLFLIYDFKIGIFKKPIFSTFVCMFCSALHESFGIFILIYLFCKLLLMWLNKSLEIRKNWWKYIICFAGAIIGFSFLFFAPSTLARMGSDDSLAAMTIFEKLSVSIPKISDNIFNVFNIYNIFPILWAVSIIYHGFKNDRKILFVFVVLFISLSILLFIFKTGWICLLIGILLFVGQLLILWQNNGKALIGILVGAYTIIYSLAITNEYVVTRTGYYFFMFISLFIVINFSNNIQTSKEKYIIGILIVIGVINTTIIEIGIYHYIGTIKNDRMEAIINVKQTENMELEVKMIKAPFDRFHIDPNSPANENYWAYKHFLHYYNLDENVKVKLVE